MLIIYFKRLAGGSKQGERVNEKALNKWKPYTYASYCHYGVAGTEDGILQAVKEKLMVRMQQCTYLC